MDSKHQMDSNLIRNLIYSISKKLEAFILPVHVSWVLSQMTGLHRSCLTGSDCSAFWCTEMWNALYFLSPFTPIYSWWVSDGVSRGGVRRGPGDVWTKEQRVKMWRDSSSKRCSALIGCLSSLHLPLGLPSLQNYSELISIAWRGRKHCLLVRGGPGSCVPLTVQNHTTPLGLCSHSCAVMMVMLTFPAKEAAGVACESALWIQVEKAQRAPNCFLLHFFQKGLGACGSTKTEEEWE